MPLLPDIDMQDPATTIHIPFQQYVSCATGQGSTQELLSRGVQGHPPDAPISPRMTPFGWGTSGQAASSAAVSDWPKMMWMPPGSC